MANFYSIQGQCAAFVAGKLSDLQWKNISHVERDKEQCILHMKNGDRYELKIEKLKRNES